MQNPLNTGLFNVTRGCDKLYQKETRMEEKDIEKMIKRNVEKYGGKFLKFVSPGNSGVPDRIAIFPGGEIWFLELKTDDGRPRPLQKKWNAILLKLGCNAMIIRGEEQAREWINEICSTRLPEESY